MIKGVTVVAVIMLLLLGVVALVGQTAEKSVAWLPADRAIPQTIVVKAAVPDTALVCMEPPTGTVICRSVGLFRAWMHDSTAGRIKK